MKILKSSHKQGGTLFFVGRSVIAAGVAVLLGVTTTLQAAAPADSQVVLGWKPQLTGALNFSQTNYDNWSQGGEDAVTWFAKVDGKANWRAKNQKLENTGKLEFGQTKLGDRAFRKALDEIRLGSVYSYLVGLYVNPYASMQFQTQFAKGYEYDDSANTKTPVSHIMDPGYLTESVGLGIEPTAFFKSRLGFAVKHTFRDEESGYGGVDVEAVQTEPGLESVTNFEHKLNEWALYQTELGVFVNFEGVDEIDWRWNNLVTVQFMKYLQASYSLEMYRDLDTQGGVDAQTKNILSVGLVYNFF
jgi:hypothetical protein